MKHASRLALFLLLLAPPCAAAQGVGVPAKIRAASVTIFAGDSRGSGTLTTTKDGTVWCLTAAHVLRDGKGHFPTAKLAHFTTDLDGATTETSVLAEVIRWDPAADLCLLRAGKKIMGSPIMTFAAKTPPVDTVVWHCGSLRGSYHHSLGKGEIVALGRWIEGRVMDQADITGYGGSSGGGVFLPTGEYLGMVVWGVPCRITCYLPIRSIRAWARGAGVEFVIDPRLPVPEEIEADDDD